MYFFSKILGYRDFFKKEDFKKTILSDYHFEQFEDKENVENAETIVFFQTKRQQTWLLVTDKNMYCILDDIATDNFEIKWNIFKGKLINSNNEVILNLKFEPNYKELSGKVDFGDYHKGWLYSRKLYPDPKLLETEIKSLIISQMSSY